MFMVCATESGRYCTDLDVDIKASLCNYVQVYPGCPHQ